MGLMPVPTRAGRFLLVPWYWKGPALTLQSYHPILAVT